MARPRSEGQHQAQSVRLAVIIRELSARPQHQKALGCEQAGRIVKVAGLGDAGRAMMFLRRLSVATMLLVIAGNPAFAQRSQPSPEHWAQYRFSVASLIAKAVRYPEAACPDRLEGIVLVNFTIAADGRIMSRRIAKSSGHAVLDREALQAIDRVKTVPPLPPFVKKKQVTFDVPLRFSWARFLGLLKLPANCKPVPSKKGTHHEFSGSEVKRGDQRNPVSNPFRRQWVGKQLTVKQAAALSEKL